jgi:UDPglucose 6-dehydrogenase
LLAIRPPGGLEDVMQISVIGLGKVGLTLASCLVAARHRVVGADVDPRVVDDLNRGLFESPEPGVKERLLRGPSGSFTATVDVLQAVRETEVTFVIVPTPSNTLGGFSLRHVLRAVDEVGAAIRHKAETHTVAIVSTILPGSSDALIVPRLEAAAARKVGDGLSYCYNPSFIALGEVVKGIETPDYLLIGEANHAAGDVILSVHESIVKAKSPVARMSPVEAEITKIASNTHETMRVSFANMLLAICSEVPGANVDRITEALAHRMGKRFFKGAVPYGGPCWPRDNQAFSAFIDIIRAPSTLPRAVDTFNEEHGLFVLRKVLEVSTAGETVGILGLAYKPGTPVIERSFAIDLAVWLAREGRAVVGWDPMAMDEARRAIGERIAYAETGDECIRQSDVVVITNQLPELASFDWSLARQATVVDCWRCLPSDASARARRYVPLGRGPNTEIGGWLEKVAGDYYRLLTA